MARSWPARLRVPLVKLLQDHFLLTPLADSTYSALAAISGPIPQCTLDPYLGSIVSFLRPPGENGGKRMGLNLKLSRSA